MKNYDVKDKVDSLGVSIPPLERFWRLGDLTGLRQDSLGRFYRANYERGILLYALVSKYRPVNVLEFGTGRGYGSLCIAWAMEAHNLPGRVFTIDMTPPGEQFEWAIDWGDGPRLERLSRDQVWPKAAKPEWLARIKQITGMSGKAMRRWQGPRIELFFIDGGHGYATVRHDFYAALDVAAENFGILFDDYAPVPEYGVQRLIDEEVSPHFETELIYTDRRWLGGERTNLADPKYGMVWVHSENLRQKLGTVYPSRATAKFLRDYRLREWWATVRRQSGRIYRLLQQTVLSIKNRDR